MRWDTLDRRPGAVSIDPPRLDVAYGKRRDKPVRRSCERERRRQDGLVDGGPADCGAVEAMEVVWPSGAALRGEASNRPQVHWLKTVVLNVVGKGAARSRQVWVGKMSDGRRVLCR